MCAFVMHNEILFTLVRALVKRFIELFTPSAILVHFSLCFD